MVHLMTAENRDRYRLEFLWKDAEEISAATLLAEKVPARRKTPAGARTRRRRAEP